MCSARMLIWSGDALERFYCTSFKFSCNINLQLWCSLQVMLLLDPARLPCQQFFLIPGGQVSKIPSSSLHEQSLSISAEFLCPFHKIQTTVTLEHKYIAMATKTRFLRECNINSSWLSLLLWENMKSNRYLTHTCRVEYIKHTVHNNNWNKSKNNDQSFFKQYFLLDLTKTFVMTIN